MTATAVLADLVVKATAFVNAVHDAMPVQECPSDPCPFCTAGTELQLSVAQAGDFLDNPQEGSR